MRPRGPGRKRCDRRGARGPSRPGATNDLGEYRLHGLAPGRYFVSAIHRQTGVGGASVSRAGASPGGSAPEEGYAPTYYPSTVDPARAIPVEAGAGAQIRGIDLTLSRTRMVRIRGRLTNSASSRPARNMMVTLLPRESGNPAFFNRNATAVRDPEGNFEIRGVTPAPM